jgi:hypothetical protein
MNLKRTRILVGLLVAALLGLFTATVAAPATPAHASPSTMICFPIYHDGQIVDWRCLELPVFICPPPCGPWGIDLRENIVLPRDVESGYLDALGNGLALVGAAAVEPDPRQAAALRERAEEQFLASAAILGDVEVSLGATGFADLRRNALGPPTEPWLEKAGTDVGNGIWYMQAALAGPDPSPWLDAGMQEFSSAYEHLATHR